MIATNYQGIQSRTDDTKPTEENRLVEPALLSRPRNKAHLVKNAGSKTKGGKLYRDFMYSDARVGQGALWEPEVHLWRPWLHSRLLHLVLLPFP